MRPKGYWQDLRNVRSFFVAFAKENGFDPVVADNWHAIPLTSFIERNVGFSRFVLMLYPLFPLFILISVLLS